MQRVLVIGSEGNLGKPLVQYLRSRGCEVLECDQRPRVRDGYMMADINHAIDLLPAFDWRPDVVVALAAAVGRETCEQAAALSTATNLTGLNNVLQLCKRAGAFLVFFSTSEVYGPHCDPMDEADSNPQPNNRYGLEKLLGEKLVEYEVRTHGLRAVTLRPCMIYDENEDFGDHRSAMIRFAGRLASGLPVEVHRGSARGWLHVSDLVRAVEAGLHVPDYMTINVGHGDVVPIADLAERIRRELDAPAHLLIAKDLPPRMTLVKRPVLERQTNVLGVVPRVSLAEGVHRVTRRIKERLRQGESVRWAA